METKHLLALIPPPETESYLMQVQAEVAQVKADSETLPPLIPLFYLCSLPNFELLQKVKQVLWPRLDISAPWIMQPGPNGQLNLPIDKKQWLSYRESISRVSGMAEVIDVEDQGFSWLEIRPCLLLSPGGLPEVWAVPALTGNRSLVINAPRMAVLLIMENAEDTFMRMVSWEMLASHRVCKSR